jgi:hypothetical protein
VSTKLIDIDEFFNAGYDKMLDDIFVGHKIGGGPTGTYQAGPGPDAEVTFSPVELHARRVADGADALEAMHRALPESAAEAMAATDTEVLR